MERFYYTNTARIEAIKKINRQIDKLMALSSNTLGGYGEATAICENLNILADAIFNEIKADYKNISSQVRYER